MVGYRTYPAAKTFSLDLENLIPKNNLYRQLKQLLDLSFLYQAVEPYYGKCGQKSIDPVVFFKLLLVGHFENLTSDRHIVRSSGLRLDILYFLDYKPAERLPCHSTISRTRKRLPATLFEDLFKKVLQMCIDKGMVSGQSQAIDGAFVQANASLGNLQPKYRLQWTKQENEQSDNKQGEVENSQSRAQKSPFTLIERTRKPRRLPANNAIYQSPTDPEARLAYKSGKLFRFYYLSSMAVDTHQHVITHMQADYADGRDSLHLLPLVEKLVKNFKKFGLPTKNIVADTNFGSGINYSSLESLGITAYIPLHGSYHALREGFTYDGTRDIYVCSQGKKLTNKGISFSKGYANYFYVSSSSDCKDCPIKKACLGKRKKLRLAVTAYRNQYIRMQQRLESRQGAKMKRARMATVEPVFGSLINYFGMRRVNTKGRVAAHKIMLMAAAAYNLKKLLFYPDRPKAQGNILTLKEIKGNHFILS